MTARALLAACAGIVAASAIDSEQGVIAPNLPSLSISNSLGASVSSRITRPLGIGSGAIPDEHMSSSSIHRAPYTLFNPWFGRVFAHEEPPSEGAWCAGLNRVGEWLQVDLGRDYTVTAVATQGRAGYDQWVTRFALEFSRDGLVWIKSSTGDYPGNSDSSTIVVTTLQAAVTSRYVRFVAKGWINQIAMRVEVYGYTPECQAQETDRVIGTPCAGRVMPRLGLNEGEAGLTLPAPGLKFGLGFPLGVESGAISDGQMSASSSFTPSVSTREDKECQLWAVQRAETLRLETAPYPSPQPERPAVAVRKGFVPVPRGSPTVVAGSTVTANVRLAQSSAAMSEEAEDAAATAEAAAAEAGVAAAEEDAERGSPRLADAALSAGVDAEAGVISEAQIGSTAFAGVEANAAADTAAETGVVLAADASHAARLHALVSAGLAVETRDVDDDDADEADALAAAAKKGKKSKKKKVKAAVDCGTYKRYDARFGRLNMQAQPFKAGGWKAARSRPGEWLQVDLGALQEVDAVATQGRANSDEYVTFFRLSYSEDGRKWRKVTGPADRGAFAANSDADTLVKNVLPKAVLARHLRFTVQKYNSAVGMRVEAYGPGRGQGCMLRCRAALLAKAAVFGISADSLGGASTLIELAGAAEADSEADADALAVGGADTDIEKRRASGGGKSARTPEGALRKYPCCGCACCSAVMANPCPPGGVTRRGRLYAAGRQPGQTVVRGAGAGRAVPLAGGVTPLSSTLPGDGGGSAGPGKQVGTRALSMGGLGAVPAGSQDAANAVKLGQPAPGNIRVLMGAGVPGGGAVSAAFAGNTGRPAVAAVDKTVVATVNAPAADQTFYVVQRAE